jgi:hypothetical protein
MIQSKNANLMSPRVFNFEIKSNLDNSQFDRISILEDFDDQESALNGEVTSFKHK